MKVRTNGNTRPITPRKAGADIEASVPACYQRASNPPWQESPAEHAAFLAWAVQPEGERHMAFAVRAIGYKSTDSVRKWKNRHDWESRLARSPDHDHGRWATMVLRARYPDVLARIASDLVGVDAPSLTRDVVGAELQKHVTPATDPNTVVDDGATAPHSPPIVGHAELALTEQRAIIESGLSLVRGAVESKTMSVPKWSEVPGLVRAAQLLAGRPTELVGTAGGLPMRDSTRVEAARETGDDHAIATAMRDDLRELTAAFDALLVPVEDGNLIPFPQPAALVAKDNSRG